MYLAALSAYVTGPFGDQYSLHTFQGYFFFSFPPEAVVTESTSAIRMLADRESVLHLCDDGNC
jgi:hypothetical protein